MEAKIIITCKVCGKILVRTPRLTDKGTEKVLINALETISVCDKCRKA